MAKDKFDDLIRNGEDMKAFKMLIKELYDGHKIGGTRKRLMERILEYAIDFRYKALELLPELVESLQEATIKLNDIPHGNFYKEEVNKYEKIIEKVGKKIEENNGCDWCNINNECIANSANFENPENGDEISIMFALNEMQIGFNGNFAGRLEINHCPMCGKKLRESERE